ncbi:MAG: hypothetical protein WD097_02245 [Balneolales bacterium]
MSIRTCLICCCLVTVIILLETTATPVQAQYSYDVLRLAKQVPGQDAHSLALGSSSVSKWQGLGSVINNPAVAAQASGSSFSVGFGIRDVEQETTYLGQPNTFDDNQSGLSHFGFNYKVPTVTGNMVLGGGYIQTADYNSAFMINAHNDLSSRTYQFLTDYTQSLAYSTFAIDSLGNNLASVFEFGNWVGVDQFAETTRRGQSGEYNLFLATEFQEDFFVGLSVGLPVSSSRFRQTFIEYSMLDHHTGGEGSGTFNIDQVLFEETIHVDAVGLNARIGLLYTGIPLIDIGASYTTGTRWNVEERFDAFIQSSFQDVVTLDGNVIVDEDGIPFDPVIEGEHNGQYSYNATTPSRMQLGVSSKNLPFINLSISAERINYGRIRLKNFDVQDRNDQIRENQFINDNFRDVWNFRAGAAFTPFGSIEPRVGWAMMNNPVDFIEDNNRQFLSAGLGFGMNQRMTLDFAVQYGLWKTTDDLYYVDAETGMFVDNNNNPITFIETADQDVERFHAMIGMKIEF